MDRAISANSTNRAPAGVKRTGRDVFPSDEEMPEIMMIDEGRFQRWLFNHLGEKQLRHVLSLVPPLQRQMMICLYNAFAGENPNLTSQLDRYINLDSSDPVSTKHRELDL